MRVGSYGWCLSLTVVLAAACGQQEIQPGSPPPGGGSGCMPICTGNGGDATGDESGGEEDEDFVCGEKQLTPQLGRAQVLLVLDQSGSMGWDWNHDGDGNTPDTTRWAVLHDMVVWIVESFGDQFEFGVLFFPSAPMQCFIDEPIEVPVQADAAQDILGALPGADEPPNYLETPTVAALEAGRAHLHQLDEEGSRAMVLITDGAPTCGLGLDAAAAVVESAYQEDQVVTYAVGLAVPDWAVEGFEAVAEAGGAPASGEQAFYDVQTQAEFEAAIAEITEQLKPCTILLDPEPELPAKLKIRIDGGEVPQINDCKNGDGWVYLNPNGPFDVVQMCGGYCEQLQAGDVDLIADYACPSVTPGP